MKQIIWTTTNFIVPCMIIFLAFLAFFLYPRVYINPGGGQAACMTGKPPSEYKEIALPPIGEPNQTIPEDARDQFVLIRKDVPVSGGGGPVTAFCSEVWRPTTATCPHFYPYRTAEYPNDIVLYPQKGAGEHDYYDRALKKNTGLWLWGEKMLFFLHLNSYHDPTLYGVRPVGNDSELIGPDGTRLVEKILVTDVYQLKSRYEQVMRGETTYNYQDIFQCDEHGALPKLTRQQMNDVLSVDPPIPFPSANTGLGADVVIPDQSPSSDNQQLQLEWFVFNSAQGVWNSHCKPAVYLYPPKKMQINVKVYPSGVLSYTDPQYDMKDGWNVEAYPDGTLTTNYQLQPTNYPYLYFESKVRDEVIKKPSKGWVVRSESSVMSQESKEWFEPLEKHFNKILPQLGLNSQQTVDFIDYWKKALQPAPYYFVGVIDQSNVDQIERLEITPKPDNINRVRIYFERLDTPKTVESPVLTSPLPLNASRFNVVEWGGMVKNDPNHPFTCSQ